MTSIPISRTKVIPPRRRVELLTRKRLLDGLFEAFDKKLIMVSAPAGYGKTSLLIDLANQSELPCGWLSLDEMDREPQRFIAYFIAALSERFPKFGSQSASILGGFTSLEQDMERMLVTLVNEAYEQIHEHFILVLDDFHLVEGVQPIQAFLNRFVQLVDENCHLIISSRTLTSLPDLPLMVARDQVSGFGFDDLAFLPEEIQALLEQNSNVRISDEEARKMIEETEGWITGLQFIGTSTSSGDLIKPALNTGVGLSDFLGQQVLNRQTPALRDFLLRTSLLEEFDASLCQAVLAPLYPEPQNWQDLIGAIVQNNLFVLPVGAEGKWLRYHHLFRDFLRSRFEQEHPAEVKPILFRMGHAYEDLGEWEKAHYIYKQLNDSVMLAEMIERSGFSMMQRALLTVESWLKDLPPSLLRTRPALLSIRGTISYMKGDLHGGLDLLNQAEEIFRKEDLDLYGSALCLVRRATAHRFLGDYAASLKDADEAIQLTQDRDTLQDLYADALRVKGLALYRLGQARQSIEILEHSLDLIIRINDVINIPVLLMDTGTVYGAMGNYLQAGAAYEKALQIWRQEGNLSGQANLLNNLGVLRQLQGEYEKAALAFEEGLVCSQRSGYSRMEAYIAIGLGDLYTELEDINAARRNYQHAREVAQGMDDHFLNFYIALTEVNLALVEKNASKAQSALIVAANVVQLSDSFYEQGLLNLGLGRLSLLDGNPSQAIGELENAEHCFSQDGRKLESDSSLIWLAAAYHQTKNIEAVRQTLKGKMSAQSQINDAILVTVHQAGVWLDGLQKDPEIGRMVGDLLTRAGRLSQNMHAVRRQIHRMAHVVEIPHAHLFIRAFGQTSVTVGGKLLTLSDWQTQSVRDLFFFFLTSRRSLTKEQVGEILWPEIEDPQKIKLRFKNEIYRLRRAVGQDVIAYEDIYYHFNHALDFEYDVEAFESYLARARLNTNPSEQADLYQKAVDLVQGPFLQDVYADWAVSERERLGQVYLSTLITLAELFQKQAQPERALAACQRALDYDSTCEAAYSLSMQVYHRMGDRAAVMRMYQTCEQTMKSQLGLTPTKETMELYRRLIV